MFVVMDIIPVWTSKPAGGEAVEVIDEYYTQDKNESVGVI